MSGVSVIITLKKHLNKIRFIFHERRCGQHRRLSVPGAFRLGLFFDYGKQDI
jgi:hypothetical protein